jgi:acyl-CoA synthetase (AMP-forming)/AMP-acid ligase II
VVYATTEFGVLLKTHRLDGWYEVASLERRHAEWRVSQGILEIKKDRVWYSTGDLVERQGELMRVIGRAGEVANVAGTKVNLAEVSGAAEEVAGVRRAMAMAESNTITGQIVCLKYVVERGYKPEEVQRRLEEHLRLRLRKEAWPRRYEEGETGLGNNAKRVQSRSMHSGGY